MAYYTEDSSNNDTTPQAPTSSQPHGFESNNIRPPQAVFSCEIRIEGYDYLEGYPLERLNDTNTFYLDSQTRQVNWLLDTTKHVIPVSERVW